MKNLIISWKEKAAEEHGSINEGVRHLNNVCGTKVTSSCINSMSKGQKAIPACINRYMTREVLPSEFKTAKFKMSSIDLGVLLDRISIPARVK